jgi:spore coat protein JB
MINNRFNRCRQAFYNGGDNNTGNPNNNQQQMPSIPNNVKSMQKRLQKVSFALVELVLYLDAYPTCEKAKKYYKELSDERDMLVKALSKAGMPMSSMNVQGNEWTWINGPWPWEYEANV